MKVVGADGCSGGWFTISIIDFDNVNLSLFPDIYTLWKSNENASLILVDIPIGLKDKCKEERLCDLEARKILGRKRAMSVFPAPCRSTLYAKDYRDACRTNKKMTARKISIQTWNIIPKIKEVDSLIIESINARYKIKETHPEICFLAFKGKPMKYSKKIKSGFNERKELLNSIYPPTNDIIKHALNTYKRKEVKKDDILDALIASVTAINGINKLTCIPKNPEIDSKGIRMQIIYTKNNLKLL
jgi:predicted RNase H-like nuclease